MTVLVIPGSKSITNRALVLAAEAEGRTVLRRPLVADDTKACAQALAALGYQIHTTDPARWEVAGHPADPPAAEAEVYTRDGATGARFRRAWSPPATAGTVSTPPSRCAVAPLLRCLTDCASSAPGSMATHCLTHCEPTA